MIQSKLNIFTKKISKSLLSMSSKYSIPDQPKRFALAKDNNNNRVLDINSFYKSDYLKGKNVLITG